MGRVLSWRSLLFKALPTVGSRVFNEASPNVDGIPSSAWALDAYANWMTHYPAGYAQLAFPMVWSQWIFNAGGANIAPGASVTATFDITLPSPVNLEVVHHTQIIKDVVQGNGSTAPTVWSQTVTEQLYLDNVAQGNPAAVKFLPRTSYERLHMFPRFEAPNVAAGLHTIKSIISCGNTAGSPRVQPHDAGLLTIIGWPVGMTYNIQTGALT